ncbi:chaperone protein Dnaj 15, partial [Phtheirospermum japonicum]
KKRIIRQFETEYRKAVARFQEVTNRGTQEKKHVGEMLKQRDSIYSSFTVSQSLAVPSGSSSSSKFTGEDYKSESPGDEGSADAKDKSSKKKCFNLNLKGSDKK